MNTFNATRKFSRGVRTGGKSGLYIFLHIVKNCAAELKTQLYIANRIGLLPEVAVKRSIAPYLGDLGHYE